MNNPTLSLQIQSDLDLLPNQTASQRVLELVIQSPPAPQRSGRPRLNLALVIDRSGSMHGAKLEYVKRAAEHILDLLQSDDRAALVTYDNQVDVLAPATLMNEEVRAEIKTRIRRLESGNTTNLSGGWLAGCHEVASGAEPERLNRALLLTDGLANQGITDEETLYQHARELAVRGVTTSTFGVGEGFNEHLLEGMSNQGGGSFYFIGSPAEIPAIFEREFKELAAVTAKDVELEIELPAGVSCQILGEWRTQDEDRRLKVYLNPLYGGRTQEVYLKLLLPPASGQDKLEIKLTVRARGSDNQPLVAQAAAAFHYADQQLVQATPPRREVLERFARVDMAQVTSEALKMERRGEREKARKLVQNSLSANAPYLAPTEASEYQDVAERMEKGMEELDRKQTHYRSYNVKRGRES